MSAQSKGQLVRYQHGKTKFEVLTKPGSALKYRQGKLGWDKVLMAEAVFTNSSRGDVAGGKDLDEAFGTNDIDECCKIIVEKGELQLSAQERKDELESKKNEVIQFIFKNYMDPKTKLPHPPDRIENCMKDCHIKIDPKRDAKKQAEEAIKSMTGKLSFTKQVAMIARLFIKHSYLGQCNNIIHAAGHVTDQDWKSRPDGCVFILELSKAELDRLTDSLRKPTNGGDFDLKIEGDVTTMSNTDASQEAVKPSKSKGNASQHEVENKGDEPETTQKPSKQTKKDKEKGKNKGKGKA